MNNVANALLFDCTRIVRAHVNPEGFRSNRYIKYQTVGRTREFMLHNTLATVCELVQISDLAR
jgi:hypothetical protein